MKVRTSTDSGSIRSEDWTDPSGLGIGGATSETNVIYIRTWGNDTTGAGTLAAPYATASKAYSVWSSGKVLDFGIGNFGAGTFANSGATLYLRGMHSRKTILGAITLSGNATTIIGDGNVSIQGIESPGADGNNGGNGAAGTNGVSVGEAGGDGNTGTAGDNGQSPGNLVLVQLKIDGDINMVGGNGGSGGTGGDGGTGGPGDGGTMSGGGGNGGNGGDAGYGGAGGNLTTYDCFINGTFYGGQGTAGGPGSGGSGGSPGVDGGAGTGSPGTSGSTGFSPGGSSDGSVTLVRSFLQTTALTPSTTNDWTVYDGPN